MSRISDVFRTARKAKRAAFVAYVTAGDPSLEHTVSLATALRRGGADLLEIGVPFSDPIADGPTNQQAAERALAVGTTLEGVIEVVHKIRAEEDLPIVLFTYANPVVRYGIDRFAVDAAAAGVDGILFTDVPVEEMDRFLPALGNSGLESIQLVTPTSPKERIKKAAKIGGGFLYVVSRTGVTGARKDLETELGNQVKTARRASKLPVAVGFGISTPAQVAQVAAIADGVIVGSAIVDRIGRLGACDELEDSIQRFVTPFTEACRR